MYGEGFHGLSGLRLWELSSRSSVDLVIADENKRSGTSIRYWFHVLDVEERGVISEQCVRLFYKSQVDEEGGFDTDGTTEGVRLSRVGLWNLLDDNVSVRMSDDA